MKKPLAPPSTIVREGFSWGTLGIVMVFVGVALQLAGIFLLWGAGWTLLAAALPCIGFGLLIMRGAKHGG